VAAPRVLVVFHVCAVHTAELAAEVAGILRAAGLSVDLRPVGSAPDPRAYDAVVVGDGVHADGPDPELVTYVERHLRTVRSPVCAAFLVGSEGTPATGVAATSAGTARDLVGLVPGFRPVVTARFATSSAPTPYGWVRAATARDVPPTVRDALAGSNLAPHEDPAAIQRFARRLLAHLVGVRTG
jgi:menaquinone-dependent protoporphyrinogen IX oxidase